VQQQQQQQPEGAQHVKKCNTTGTLSQKGGYIFPGEATYISIYQVEGKVYNGNRQRRSPVAAASCAAVGAASGHTHSRPAPTAVGSAVAQLRLLAHAVAAEVASSAWGMALHLPSPCGSTQQQERQRHRSAQPSQPTAGKDVQPDVHLRTADSNCTTLSRVEHSQGS
jgi:hypothetical protein